MYGFIGGEQFLNLKLKVYMEQKKIFFSPHQPNSSRFMLLTISLVVLLVYFVTLNGGHLVPNAWQSFVEIIYDFVPNLVNEQISDASLLK
jgi:F-type H+-transporting ATPase subunit a